MTEATRFRIWWHLAGQQEAVGAVSISKALGIKRDVVEFDLRALIARNCVRRLPGARFEIVPDNTVSPIGPKPTRSLKAAEREEIVQRAMQGVPCETLAREYLVYERTVRMVLKDAGIEPRSLERQQRRERKLGERAQLERERGERAIAKAEAKRQQAEARAERRAQMMQMRAEAAIDRAARKTGKISVRPATPLAPSVLDQRRQARDERQRERVLAALRRVGSALTTTEVILETSLNGATTGQRLAELLASGYVTRRIDVRNGSAFEMWALAETERSPKPGGGDGADCDQLG